MEKVRIKMVVDPPKEFLESWKGNIKAYNWNKKKGWKTWILDDDVECIGTNAPVFPENNKYQINFPGKFFKIIKSPMQHFKEMTINAILVIIAAMASFAVGLAFVAIIMQFIKPF